MRKLKNPVLFLFIAGTICAAGTAAYFSDSDNRINEVAVGILTGMSKKEAQQKLKKIFRTLPPHQWRIIHLTEKKSGQEIFPAVKKDLTQTVM